MAVGDVLSLGVIAMMVAVSVWLAYVHVSDSPPGTAGLVYRLLHASQYLDPKTRTCPSCGGTNPATAVRCISPAHRPGEDDDLSVRGEVLTKTHVRNWGLRVLFGLVITSTLLVGRPLAVYASVAAVALWILVPLMACYEGGRFIFLLLVVAGLVAVGVLTSRMDTVALAQFTRQDPSLLPVLHVGALHLNLNTARVTPATLWLNVLAANGVLIGVLLSFWSQLRHRDKFHDGVLTVPFMGTVVGALMLMTLCVMEHLTGLALLYLALAVMAFGWLLVALLGRALVRSLATVNWALQGLRIDRISYRPRPKLSLRPMTARGSFATFVRTIQVLVFGITRGALEVIVTLLNLAIGAINLFTTLLMTVIDLLLSLLIWIVNYLVEVLRSLWREMVKSVPVLYRLGTVGFGVSLFGPALVLTSSLLFATCASAGIRYLATSDLRDLAFSLGAFASAAIALAIAATFYVDGSLLRAFFGLLQDYVPNAIISFAIYLDVYGLSRLILRAPSHFGLFSIALNVIVAAGALFGLAQQLGQRSTA